MIPARHNPFLSRLLSAYLHRLFRRHFRAIFLTGEGDFDAFLRNDASYPLVFFSNHQSWWDGFFEAPLIKRYAIKPYIMMEEKNLRKFRYFRNTGVFGIDLDSTAERARGLLYAVRQLKAGSERRGLFLYPHGRLLGAYEPWPPFMSGLEVLLRHGPRAAVPVFKRILPGGQPLPTVCLHIGAPVEVSNTPDTTALERALIATGRAQERFLAQPEWERRAIRYQ